MTIDMHVIAQKTKVETVSMRIITWVTLFFLPGTFISVRVSSRLIERQLKCFQTLMSTPIVHFNKTNPDFSIKNIGFGALKLYLAASLPLVLITLLAWWAMRVREKRSEKMEARKIENERMNDDEKLIGD